MRAHISTNWTRVARGAAGGCALVFLGACMDLTNVPNYDNESLDALTNDPTPARVATAAQGMMAGMRQNLVGGFSYLSMMAWRGRDGFNLDPATPGLVTENLVGPLGPESTNYWAEGYRVIKLGNVILAALDKVTGLTAAEKEATRGYVKTIQAHAFHQIIIVHDQAGAVIDVDVDPSAGAAAGVAGRDAVYTKVTDLLDQAKTHLQAGGSAFPFKLSPGFTGFSTPSTFLKFNRALRARVDVHRASLLTQAARWTEALNALTESFLDTTQPLTLGVYHSFSTGSGDISNTSYDPTGRALLAHPSIEGKFDRTTQTLTTRTYQLRADGSPDLRFSSKIGFRIINGVRTPVSQSNVFSDLLIKVFSSNNSALPIIRNEDLILLRAEARLATGDRVGALADINLIRVNSGGLTAIADPGDPGLMNELIYNRRYSLFYEGWRWVDMRRWGRLSELEQDLASHRIFRWSPLPLAECTARSPQPGGCAAEAGLTGVPLF
ncbi:MAG: RagB/SusD family nutrient uptake outer membrane protein [Gemmatimonadetes bacterium]|nr:RagB/SusD family nutrient uptake outer membrane protein [Gemmatimonadota bacterium]